MSVDLTAAQLARIEQWKGEQFPDGLRCPACQHVGHEPGPLVVCLPVDAAAGEIVDDEPMDTLIPLRCPRCGCVMLFDAEAVGVLAEELLSPAEEPAGDESGDQARGETHRGELDHPDGPRLHRLKRPQAE